MTGNKVVNKVTENSPQNNSETGLKTKESQKSQIYIYIYIYIYPETRLIDQSKVNIIAFW